MTRRFFLLLIISVMFVTFAPSLVRLVTSATDGVRQGYEQVEIGMRADQVRGIFSNDADFEDELGEEIIAEWISNEGRAVVVFDKNQLVIHKEWWRKDSGGFFAEVVMIITGGRRTGTPWTQVHKLGNTGKNR